MVKEKPGVQPSGRPVKIPTSAGGVADEVAQVAGAERPEPRRAGTCEPVRRLSPVSLAISERHMAPDSNSPRKRRAPGFVHVKEQRFESSPGVRFWLIFPWKAD